VRNLRKTMLSDTTGSRKKADNSGKSMVCTGELLTFGSVPLILMPHLCASRLEESTWVTIHTTSWMEESAALF
jgi:hypothetical protein